MSRQRARRAVAASALVACTLACGRTPSAPPAAAPPALPRAPAPESSVVEIDRIVRARFYDPKVLEERRWAEQVQQASARLARTPAEKATILRDLVASLRTSHTEYIGPGDPHYAQILSIFEPTLKSPSPRCPDPGVLPAAPVQSEDVDVWWRDLGGRWFVGGVLQGGAAERAGLLLGDEVVQADGRPFSPVASFAGTTTRTKTKTETQVRLSIRRVAGGPLLDVRVTPRRAPPQEAFRDALRASARVIERGAAKIGYVHVWSWAGDEMQDELEDAIDRLNQQHVTHVILDIRDGWGGAAPSYVRVFDRHVPVFESTMRDGKHYRRDPVIRVPAAVLVNRGSRSGKEGIAHAIREHHLATLVGEPTGGSALPGSLFCLSDGAVMYLAVGELTVDGARLEGRGVPPDTEIPFDIRYAAGRDPQLEGAIGALVK